MTRSKAFVLLAVVSVVQVYQGLGFTCYLSSLRSARSARRQIAMALGAVTPIGPFCPFRSKASSEMEVPMEELQTEGPAFATAFARINLDFQMGKTPDKDQLLTAADGLQKAVTKWESMTTKMRKSTDFQTREYAKLTEAHLANYDENIDSLIAGLKWQAECLRAMADGGMPPMPPPGLDIQKMMENAQMKASMPSVASMTAAERITGRPFSGDGPAFESPVIKKELDVLCRDHSNLIEFGARYGHFDPVGKLYFLDEIEKIEERWDVFFARFSLMNAIDKKYVKQCNRFLESMNMNEADYRKLLKKAHDLMREEAELERNLVGL